MNFVGGSGGGVAAIEGVFTSIAYVSITGDTDDLDLLALGTSLQYYLNPDADGHTITGVVTGGVTRLMRLTNVSSTRSIIFADEDAGSTAANRFITGLGIDYTLPPLGTLTMMYDVTANRWRIDV